MNTVVKQSERKAGKCRTQGDQMIRKNCQIFQRIAQKSRQVKKTAKAQFENPKHLYQTTFETLKYLQQTMF
jgi:hypothetical protein